MKNLIKDIKNEFNNKENSVIIILYILSFIVVFFLVNEIIDKNISNILICILTLILFLIPSVVSIKLKLLFPPMSEIIIYILIFSAQILGEVLGFYVRIEIFDTILHLLYGFVMTLIGFSLINIFYKSGKIKFKNSYKYFLLFGFCYGMTSGISWEMLEYSVDKIFNQDMQDDTIITEISSIKFNKNNDTKPKTIEIESLIVNGEDYMKEYNGYIDIGLNDTMKDIIFNLIGGIIFLIMGYNYLKGKCKVVNKLMIKKG